MNDELPEPLNRVSPLAAPRELRPRVLSAVTRELSTRRKPRWERVLELSAAALVVIGIGLNAWQASQPDVTVLTRKPEASQVAARNPDLLDRELDQSLPGRMAIRQVRLRDVENSRDSYRRLLAEVSKQPAG